MNKIMNLIVREMTVSVEKTLDTVSYITDELLYDAMTSESEIVESNYFYC